MKLHPYFGRVGSKRFLKTEVFALMPNDYDIYVEPFVGGGAVFLGLDTTKPIFISDIDSELMNAYLLLQEGCEGDIENYDINDIPTLQNLKDGTPTTKMGKLVKYMIKSSNTFGNKGFGKVYKTTNPYNKLKHLEKYQTKLDNITILSGDYKEIMRATDSQDTFFYLDPPYCGTKGLYKNEKFDHADLVEFLKTIRETELGTIPILVLTGADLSEEEKKFLSGETLKILEKSDDTFSTIVKEVGNVLKASSNKGES